ncbi:MAG: cupredoxin domain-containing protein [Alphaproteobacteria bacterium]|nr:cupredoxin domain-containing protein [Alphaproteobacteria bacterium]
MLVGVFACALAIAVPGAGAEPTVDWANAQRVDLVEVDYAFQPNHLTFRRDRTYQLHVENRGHELHELTAPDFFKAVELRDPSVLNQDGTELVVKPGDQKDLYLVPLQPGRYGMRCADHDWAGMTGDITVD